MVQELAPQGRSIFRIGDPGDCPPAVVKNSLIPEPASIRPPDQEEPFQGIGP
jgi:hypothetical protein